MRFPVSRTAAYSRNDRPYAKNIFNNCNLASSKVMRQAPDAAERGRRDCSIPPRSMSRSVSPAPTQMPPSTSYGVGVGRAGMAWSGTANVAMKREWPRWTPTKDMIGREPDKYVKWARGMEGGTQNPLGARALYLFKDGKDTLYRIHGTNEPWSIGQAMSSGCIRMMNQDVIDLYRRVPSGAKVVVLPASGVETAASDG
ncbi:L,D-transpeptidase [Bradyrhizobium symbiodeficiens]|uniref:L,D-transpeptidase n=1 Tax=Bradyrhizobium symbiodeficiens TaxID=1404367 RepID=UPI0038CC0177